ncbi:hypothetical protein MTO96_008648 [Rhipicephalus appendiculatus]
MIDRLGSAVHAHTCRFRLTVESEPSVSIGSVGLLCRLYAHVSPSLCSRHGSQASPHWTPLVRRCAPRGRDRPVPTTRSAPRADVRVARLRDPAPTTGVRDGCPLIRNNALAIRREALRLAQPDHGWRGSFWALSREARPVSTINACGMTTSPEFFQASLSTSAFGSCDDAVSAVDVAREDRGKTAGRGLSTFLAAFNEHCVMQRQSNAE